MSVRRRSLSWMRFNVGLGLNGEVWLANNACCVNNLSFCCTMCQSDFQSQLNTSCSFRTHHVSMLFMTKHPKTNDSSFWLLKPRNVMDKPTNCFTIVVSLHVITHCGTWDTFWSLFSHTHSCFFCTTLSLLCSNKQKTKSCSWCHALESPNFSIWLSKQCLITTKKTRAFSVLTLNETNYSRTSMRPLCCFKCVVEQNEGTHLSWRLLW